MKTQEKKRWEEAQESESSYWAELTVGELLRICAEKPSFLGLVGHEKTSSLFDGKAVMEIGVGPLGVSLASFYPKKSLIRKLVKVEPLAQMSLLDSPLVDERWAYEFIKWVHSLGQEGEYRMLQGEAMDYENQFDTVIIYNVLDHVNNPEQILSNAYSALKKGGRVLIGVDCRSVRGRLKFEHVTRRRFPEKTIVQAHPYTFLPGHVKKMVKGAGFVEVECHGTPGLVMRLIGPSFRPAFIARKTV